VPQAAPAAVSFNAPAVSAPAACDFEITTVATDGSSMRSVIRRVPSKK
jgi:hypothetical protein